jgi:hypothetical protein
MKKLAPLTLVAICVAFSFAGTKKSTDQKDSGKAVLSLRATPAMAFAPARITLSGQLKGGSEATDDFYCPTIQWDWGDGTISEASSDCDPFQPNKSEIQRSFTVQHVYKLGGEYTVTLNLKKGDKVMAFATASLNISRALGEDVIR